MRIRLLLVFFAVIFSSTFFAQDERKDLEQKAEKYFKEDNFVQSLPLYSQLLSLDPTNYDYNFKYGTCLLTTDIDASEPIKYLEYAVKNPGEARSWYFLGKAYHLNYQFADAIKAYERFIKSADTKMREKYSDVKRQIAMCENGKKLLNNIKDIRVLEKTETSAKEFFRSYNLEDIGGRILATPDELLSSADKKSNTRSLIHFPGNKTVLYYSSFGKDNNRDIYRVNRLTDGNYDIPVKLNGDVNTTFDEDYPFMHPNGRTLYFCSKGHNSMGGYDVFKAEYDYSTDSYGPAINLDFAINTPDDDLFYIPDSLNNVAYFASARSSANDRMHVYKVKVESVPLNLAIIKGSFESDFTSGPKDAKIIVEDAATNVRIGEYQTNPENGDYVIDLPKTGKYKFHVEAKNSQLVHTGIVDIPAFQERRAFRQEMELKSDGINEKLIIKNLFDELVDDDVLALAQELIKRQAELEVNYDPKDEPLATLRNTDISNVYTDAGFSAELDNAQTLSQLDDRIASLEKKAETFDKAKIKALNLALEKEELAIEKMSKAEVIYNQMQSAITEDAKDKFALESMKLNEESRQLADEAAIAIELAEYLNSESDKISEKVVQSSDNVRIIKDAIDNNDYEVALNKLKTEKILIEEDKKNEPYEELEQQSNDEFSLLSKSQNFAKNLKHEKELLEAKVKSREKQLSNATKKKEKDEIKNELAMMKLDLDEYEDQIRMANNDLISQQHKVSSVRGQVDLMDQLISNPESVQVDIKAQEYSSNKKDDLLQDLMLIEKRGKLVAIDPGELQTIMNKRPDLMAAYFEDPVALARFQKRFNIENNTVDTERELSDLVEENYENRADDGLTDSEIALQSIPEENDADANSPAIEEKVDPKVALRKYENDAVINWIDPTRKDKLESIDQLQSDPVKKTEQRVFAHQAFINAIDSKMAELKYDFETKQIPEELYTENQTYLKEIRAQNEETLFQENQELLQLTAALKNTENIALNESNSELPNEGLHIIGETEIITEENNTNADEVALSENSEQELVENILPDFENEKEDSENTDDIKNIQYKISEALISLDTQNLSEPEELEERIKIRSNYLEVVEDAINRKKLIIEDESPDTQSKLYDEIAQLESTKSELEQEIQTDQGNLRSAAVTVINPDDLAENSIDKFVEEPNQNKSIPEKINTSAPVKSVTIPQSAKEVTEVKKEIQQKALQKLMKNNAEIIKLDNSITNTVIAARSSNDLNERNRLNQDAIEKSNRKNFLVQESTQIAEDLTQLDSWEEIMKAQISVADGGKIVANEMEQVKAITESGYKEFDYRSLEANMAYKDRAKNIAELKTLYLKGDQPAILAKEIEIGENFGLANKSEFDFYNSQNRELLSKRPLVTSAASVQADALAGDAQELLKSAVELRSSATSLPDGERKNDFLKEAYAKEILAIDKIIKAKNLNEGILNNKTDLSSLKQDQFLKETYNVADVSKDDYLAQMQSKYLASDKSEVSEAVAIPVKTDLAVYNSKIEDLKISPVDLSDLDNISDKLLQDVMTSDLNYSKKDQLKALADKDHKNYLENKAKQKILLDKKRDQTLALENVARELQDKEAKISRLESELSVETDKIVAAEKQKNIDRLKREAEILYEYASRGEENLSKINNKLAEIENELIILEPIASENLREKVPVIASETSTPEVSSNTTGSIKSSDIRNNITGELFNVDRFTIPNVLNEEIFYIGNTSASMYNATKPIPVDVAMPSGLVFQVQVGAFRNKIDQSLFNGFAPIMGDKLPSGITRYTVGLFKIFDTANNAKKEIRGLGFSDAFVVAFYDGERIPLNIARGMLDQKTVDKYNEIAENNRPKEASKDLVRGTTETDGKSAIIETKTVSPRVIPDYTKKTIEELIAEEFVPDETNAAYYNDPKAAEANPVELIGGMFYTVQVGVYSKPVPPEKIYNISPLNSQLTPGGLIKYSSGIFTNMDVAKKWRDQVVGKGVGDAFITAYYNGNRIKVKQALDLEKTIGPEVFTDYKSVSQSDKDKTGEVVWELINLSDIVDENAASINFKIRMGPYLNEVPLKEAGAILEFRQNLEVLNDKNGAISYLTKDAMSYTEAKRWKDQFLSSGIGSASIIAFENGNEISLERAFEILLQ